MTVKELIAWLQENANPDAIVQSSEEGNEYDIEEKGLSANDWYCEIG